VATLLLPYSTPAQKRLTTPSNSSSNNMLQVFPNPTTGNFSIQLPKNLKAQSIQIISLAGQVVKSLEGGVLLYHLQLNEQEKGVYLVQVITGDSVITERIIVH